MTHAQAITGSEDLRLLVDYSAKPDLRSVLAHNFCILDPAADVPLAEGRAMGHTHLAYVTTVEVIPGTPAELKAKNRGVPLLDRNPEWETAVLDLTHAGWEDWLVEDIVKPALEKGYDGVFLDTVDSMMRVIMKDPSRAAGCHKAMVSAIQRIDRQFPGKRIVLNRGFRVVQDVSTIIDGVLVEGLYRTWSPEKKTFAATGMEGTEWLLHHIERIQSHKLPVFVVDYVPPADAALAEITARRIRAKGCIPFITTPELQGEELAPLREVPRRIAVLHGGKAQGDLHPSSSGETLTSELLQGPLEWLGYQVEFFDLSKGMPPDLSPLRFRGIVVDDDLHVPVEREDELADWLLNQRRRAVKLLFTGSIPFSREQVVRRIFSDLSLQGTNKPLSFDGASSIKTPDGDIDTAPAARAMSGAREVIAPRGAKVMLSVRGTDQGGKALRIDSVFLTSWGGALLLRGLPEQSYRRIDLDSFVSEWLGVTKPFPVPDAATRDGMRALYAHFDGDGFISRSALSGAPLCGEVIRDRILKTFPVPITVSVIEAEIEAQVSGVDSRSAPRYREIARNIFALPNVQPASHTYSHPLRWLGQPSATSDPGPALNLELKPWVNYSGEIDVDREVRGSVEYINRVLTPPDKQVEMMLWSGDCRPGPEALRLCRELGIESMNGPKALSVRYPGLNVIPPSHTFSDGEMQVAAAGKNDFTCVGIRRAPFFESSENVIANFERTGSPRRLKPVNPCGDFRDASYLSSVQAMEKVFRWCMEQPLHAITSRQYAGIVRDAAATRVYELGPERWLVSNAGHVRTLRLPASANDPDMAASKGLSGWIRQNDSLYVHTRGGPLTELVLNSKPAPHLRLAECSAEIEFRALAALRAEFRVTDLRPVHAAFAGVPPLAACELVVNGKPMRLQSDSQGIVKLHLPSTAHVTLDFSTARLANRN